MHLRSVLMDLCCLSLQVDNHQTLLTAAKDKADKLHNKLQGMTNEKKLAAQQHLSTTKLCAKLDKQVLLTCILVAVIQIDLHTTTILST